MTAWCCATTPSAIPTACRPGEGVFLACSFWLADNYVLLGPPRRGGARCSSVWPRSPTMSACWPRNMIPRERRLLGNFPQAFSHIALVNTAHNIVLAEGPSDQRSRAAE